MPDVEASYLMGQIRRFVRGNDVGGWTSVADLDWERIARTITTQGLATCVGPLLADSGAPEPVARTVEAYSRQLLRRHAILEFELLRVVDRLERAAIRPVVLKGAGLGHTLYPRPGQRLFSDLDILVPRPLVDAACEALEQDGYLPLATGRHVRFYEEHHFHRVLGNAAGVALELHWSLSRPADYFQFDVGAFVERSRAIRVADQQLQVPADADQLLHAACQAVRDGLADPRRVIDASLLLERGAASDAELPRRARRQGMGTALWLLLQIQREVVGVDVPETLAREIAPSRWVGRCLLSLGLADRLLSGQPQPYFGLRRLVIWLCAPSLGAMLLQVRRFLMPGTAELLDDGHVPDRLPTVPARLAATAAQGWSLTKIVGFQAWCLMRYALGKGA